MGWLPHQVHQEDCNMKELLINIAGWVATTVLGVVAISTAVVAVLLTIVVIMGW